MIVLWWWRDGEGLGSIARLVVAQLVTSAELQQQPMAIDLALVTRSGEQLAANQDQLARKQDQIAQAIATLQSAEQDLSQQILALAAPAPKAAHVPPPKPLQPAAQ
jgi:multidrug resistance efflux pump